MVFLNSASSYKSPKAGYSSFHTNNFSYSIASSLNLLKCRDSFSFKGNIDENYQKNIVKLVNKLDTVKLYEEMDKDPDKFCRALAIYSDKLVSVLNNEDKGNFITDFVSNLSNKKNIKCLRNLAFMLNQAPADSINISFTPDSLTTLVEKVTNYKDMSYFTYVKTHNPEYAGLLSLAKSTIRSQSDFQESHDLKDKIEVIKLLEHDLKFDWVLKSNHYNWFKNGKINNPNSPYKGQIILDKDYITPIRVVGNEKYTDSKGILTAHSILRDIIDSCLQENDFDTIDHIKGMMKAKINYLKIRKSEYSPKIDSCPDAYSNVKRKIFLLDASLEYLSRL